MSKKKKLPPPKPTVVDITRSVAVMFGEPDPGPTYTGPTHGSDGPIYE